MAQRFEAHQFDEFVDEAGGGGGISHRGKAVASSWESPQR